MLPLCFLLFQNLLLKYDFEFILFFAVNRREQEKEMWARRNAQLERQGISTDAIPSSTAVAFPHSNNNYTTNNERGLDTYEIIGKQKEQPDPIKSSIYDRRNRSTTRVEVEPGGAADEDLQKILAANCDNGGDGKVLKKKLRGRGGTGPRIVGSEFKIRKDRILVEEMRVDAKIGPTRPEKRKRDAHAERGSSSGSSSCVSGSKDSESEDEGEEEEEQERRRKRRERRRRKDKSKKESDRKRKKEKRKRKKEKEKRRHDKKSKKKSTSRRKDVSSSSSSSDCSSPSNSSG